MHFEEIYLYETKCDLKRIKKEALPNKVHNIIITNIQGDWLFILDTLRFMIVPTRHNE